MPKTDLVRTALRRGTEQGERIVRFRRAQARKRAAALAKRGRTKTRLAAVAPKVRAAAGPAADDVLVAEGDSWFDYPLHDVLRLLEDEHGFEIESVAHRGDRVEDMAYTGQLEAFARRLEKLLRRDVVPRAILLSGGGNDIAGEEFAVLLDHAASPTAGVNALVLEGVIEQRIKLAFVTIIGQITHICEKLLGRRIPILIHGYDYPVPDGRGFLGGLWFLPGPWLRPGFRQKGFDGAQETLAMTRALIDRFNEMLHGLAALPRFDHVTHLDLRGTLPAGAGYKKFWANELHPTERGFSMIAAKFARAIP